LERGEDDVFGRRADVAHGGLPAERWLTLLDILGSRVHAVRRLCQELLFNSRAC
jgi:hypothetical protein